MTRTAVAMGRLGKSVRGDVSNSRRGVENGVLCGSAPRLYDSTDRVQFRE
jgi:hypothetical protein